MGPGPGHLGKFFSARRRRRRHRRRHRLRRPLVGWLVVPNSTQKWIQIHIIWMCMLTLCISMDRVGMFKQEYT